MHRKIGVDERLGKVFSWSLQQQTQPYSQGKWQRCLCMSETNGARKFRDGLATLYDKSVPSTCRSDNWVYQSYTSQICEGVTVHFEWNVPSWSWGPKNVFPLFLHTPSENFAAISFPPLKNKTAMAALTMVQFCNCKIIALKSLLSEQGQLQKDTSSKEASYGMRTVLPLAAEVATNMLVSSSGQKGAADCSTTATHRLQWPPLPTTWTDVRPIARTKRWRGERSKRLSIHLLVTDKTNRCFDGLLAPIGTRGTSGSYFRYLSYSVVSVALNRASSLQDWLRLPKAVAHLLDMCDLARFDPNQCQILTIFPFFPHIVSCVQIQASTVLLDSW